MPITFLPPDDHPVKQALLRRAGVDPATFSCPACADGAPTRFQVDEQFAYFICPVCGYTFPFHLDTLFS